MYERSCLHFHALWPLQAGRKVPLFRVFPMCIYLSCIPIIPFRADACHGAAPCPGRAPPRAPAPSGTLFWSFVGGRKEPPFRAICVCIGLPYIQTIPTGGLQRNGGTPAPGRAPPPGMSGSQDPKGPSTVRNFISGLFYKV